MSLNPTSSNASASDDFDWVRSSPLELLSPDQWRYETFSAMLQSDDPDEDLRPILLGADHTGSLDLSLFDIRRVALRASKWCKELGYVAGDSLLMVRLPYSSEVTLAAAVVALMSLGLRVVLPMAFDKANLREMARATKCRAMLWCAGIVNSEPNQQICQADAMYQAVADELQLATFSLDGELDWHLPSDSNETSSELLTETTTDALEREVLVLSTSGSTGTPKLVRYTDHALLRVAEAWNSAGLMSKKLTGGRSICPAMSHSMGLRSILHAIWNRQPVLLAQTEWLEEKTKKFVKLLERCAPQHVTCGPALLGDLALLATNVKRFRRALASLQCVVSSGAAEVIGASNLPDEITTANAFGMTEIQQVLNTLLSTSSQACGALGNPLPGVSVAVRFLNADQQLGRLYVAAPFAARGYVGEQDFGQWFDTGDLVRVVGDDLVWMGRAKDDYLNTGNGVKVSLADLRSSYKQFQQEVEATLFIETSRRGGVAAMVYVGKQDPAAAETHRQLLAAITNDHDAMASYQQDFLLAYQAITVVGCVAGRPPKRGPGKIDRTRALAEQSTLLAMMDDPLSNHPQVFNVPPHGSDRPDWRRFAASNSQDTPRQ